jgi:hypothetical protein
VLWRSLAVFFSTLPLKGCFLMESELLRSLVLPLGMLRFFMQTWEFLARKKNNRLGFEEYVFTEKYLLMNV